MAWERSWKMAYNGMELPDCFLRDWDDEWDAEEEVAAKPKEKENEKEFDYTSLPSYQRLPLAFQAILQSILDLGDDGKK